jgi:hypothetical protein
MLYGIAWYWVLLAVVVYFGAGAVWYSNALFAKAWAKELGKKVEDMKGQSMTVAPMVTTFLAMVVLVLVEAYFIQATSTHGAWRGAYLGLKLWLGFAFTTALVNHSFQQGSRKLFAIDQGYHVVGIVLAGAILGAVA